jgi:hypothetical protein
MVALILNTIAMKIMKKKLVYINIKKEKPLSKNI